MRNKAHAELAVTVTTDPSTTRALDHDAETAARVLLRTRLGRLSAPARESVPSAQPEQRLGDAEGWAEVSGPGSGDLSARASRQGYQEPILLPSLP